MLSRLSVLNFAALQTELYAVFQNPRKLLVVLCIGLLFYVTAYMGHKYGIRYEKLSPNLLTLVSFPEYNAPFSELTMAPICEQKSNVAFVKVHKAGSTTVMNIIQRFGYGRNLNFALPKEGLIYIGLYGPLSTWNIRQLPQNSSTYNIICNHVMYTREGFRKIMPNDTAYIGILRQPWEQFVSAFYYYSKVVPQKYLTVINATNKIVEYLKHPKIYDGIRGASYTHNRMALDFGVWPMYFSKYEHINKYIRSLDKDFTLVLILEKFDESLVLLKRYMCWTFKDILYVPRNRRKTVKIENTTAADKLRHRKWSQADYIFYHYFHERLLQRIYAEKNNFSGEVNHFRSILKHVQDWCVTIGRSILLNGENTRFTVPQSSWGDKFEITNIDCDLMMMKTEAKFTKKIIEKQYGKYP